MKTYIIQVEPHDDALSTRDKMAWSKAPRILLVWPRRGRVLERAVDLIVLQRHAHILGAQLGIVTGDAEVRANAGDLGIPSFSSTVQAQQGSWRKPRGARRPNWRNYHERVVPAELRKQREALRALPVENRLTRIVAFTAGVLAVLALTLFFVPAATIRLSPQRETQTLVLQAWASPEIREANPSGGMPAFAITAVVEGSVQVPSSGKVGIPERQASGDVELSNLTEQDLTIPAGTVVLAKGAGGALVRFETTRAVKLSAGIDQKVTVAVRAQVPGLQGNLPAGAVGAGGRALGGVARAGPSPGFPGAVEAVEGPLGGSLLAANPRAFQGGSERSSPAPLAADYIKAEEQLKQSLMASALDDMSRQLAADERLVNGTLVVTKVLKDVREPPTGQPADFARLSQQVEYTAWYVREKDLEAVALTALDANRSSGFQPVVGSLELKFADDAKFDENGVARWEMNVSRELEAVWSEAQAAQAVIDTARGEELSPLDIERPMGPAGTGEPGRDW